MNYSIPLDPETLSIYSFVDKRVQTKFQHPLPSKSNIMFLNYALDNSIHKLKTRTKFDVSHQAVNENAITNAEQKGAENLAYNFILESHMK